MIATLTPNETWAIFFNFRATGHSTHFRRSGLFVIDPYEANNPKNDDYCLNLRWSLKNGNYSFKSIVESKVNVNVNGVGTWEDNSLSLHSNFTWVFTETTFEHGLTSSLWWWPRRILLPGLAVLLVIVDWPLLSLAGPLSSLNGPLAIVGRPPRDTGQDSCHDCRQIFVQLAAPVFLIGGSTCISLPVLLAPPIGFFWTV